ncbi:hemin ABC transporter substrate-binding protein [Chimaeribacter californicus]|uniref:Hemin ABC transporter substrate-binding protein n=1 Tax=Chimaeribacter californicus TaxID=2060067 RepID=A0A2N5E7A5_9GAMM|nr:ABC transporter substrate-binding protein [Chimaeribacter californicus]PLR37370.1 hemin ABC transporter substrate-binding protein [Chimaeribacter californicus]
MRRALWLLVLLAGNAAAERVVTIGGDVTEIVYALGAGGELVARDSTSTRPAAAGALPDVGYMRQLNAEGILAMRPSLVLATAQAAPALALDQIRQSGVEVMMVPPAVTLDQIADKVAVVAHALHRDSQGETLSRQLRAQLDQMHYAALPTKVLFIMSHGGMSTLVAGQQTAADQVLAAAGVRNAMQGFNGYKPLSAEGVIAAAPDLVLVTTDGLRTLGGQAQVWALPGLRLTPAGRGGRLLVLDDMALLGFGPATPAAVRQLRAAAAPAP